MSVFDSIVLYDDDLCIIVTIDGRFGGCWSHDNSIYTDADMIQEMMIKIMKITENRKGVWKWRFNDGFIYSEFLKESINHLSEKEGLEMTAENKICTRCKKDKCIKEFPIKDGAFENRDSRCIACAQEMYKERYRLKKMRKELEKIIKDNEDKSND